MSRRTIILVVLSIIMLGAGGVRWMFLRGEPSAELRVVLWPQPEALSAFTLVDQRRQSFNLERLKGKWTFIFFGYTHCPDICPVGLTVLSAIYKRIKNLNPEAASNTQTVFVSVDPERDTPELLSDYVAYFNPEFWGVSGSVPEIDKFTRQLHAAYIKEPPGPSGGYLVGHTSTFFLIDPEARLYAFFSQPQIPETIVGQYLEIRSLN
ncbi:MAG: SCO family protein [Gammaproteobacteria bacterium]|nr:SCO family protein [Gammaproteobacteria bacterium]